MQLEDLKRLCEEEGVDLDEFSDEEIASLMETLSDDAARLGAVDDQNRLVEADYVARVMSEAFLAALDGKPSLTLHEFLAQVVEGKRRGTHR